VGAAVTEYVFLILGLGFVSSVIGSLVLFDRREARREDQWRVQQRVQMDETVEWMQAQQKRRRATHAEVRALRWPAVRALCERETGHSPCECATRFAAGENVFWARERRRDS